jgi:hypothetical protein
LNYNRDKAEIAPDLANPFSIESIEINADIILKRTPVRSKKKWQAVFNV